MSQVFLFNQENTTRYFLIFFLLYPGTSSRIKEGHHCGHNINQKRYRVSGKTEHTFLLLVYQLLRGLEIPSWTFFNSRFYEDFKNINQFIIWWNQDRYFAILLQGSHDNIFCQLLNKALENFRSLRSNRKYP